MDRSKDSMLCVVLSTISHLTLSPLRGTKSLSTSETWTKCSSPRSSLRKPWPRDRQKYVTVPAWTSPCTHGGVLLSTLNSLCAVMDTFLRDNGLIRILLLPSPIFAAHFSLMQHFKDILCSILLQHTITLFVFLLHKPQTHKGVLCPVVCQQ